MTLCVEVIDTPVTWGEHGNIRLVWQSRVRPVEYAAGNGSAWEMEVPLKEGVWTGPSVGRNGDGRRFLYFAWLDGRGKMFRRIKLYQDQVTAPIVKLSGTMKDGSPACSTARLI